MRYTFRSTAFGTIAGAIAVTMLVTSFTFAAPPEAGALRQPRKISRQAVISRAASWVKKRVPYSQRSTYRGYRQDCSGFVSMAWQLNTSYTTRSIASRARRISLSQIRPGDAVLTPGHVAIFVGWKNKSKRQYIAMEQPTYGKVASRRVRTVRSGARILRRKGIIEAPRVARRPAPTKPAPVAIAAATPPVSSEPTLAAMAALEATETIEP